MTLIFDLLTSNLVRVIVREVGNLLNNFVVSGTFGDFSFSTYGPSQHLSDASRDLETLTFDFGGHGACRWCGSSYSICIPSLKFVGLPFRKTLWIYCVWINRPGDLDLWPWNWCALLPVGWTTLLPIFVLLGRFVLDLSANICQTRHVTLRSWPSTLEITALASLMWVIVLRLCTKFQVRKPSRSEDIWHLLCEH